MRASYNILPLIAKSGKPYTIGKQLFLPPTEEVLKTVLYKPGYDIIQKIHLSHTVQRWMDKMSYEIESSLKSANDPFYIQLEKSTLLGNEELLLAYVCFVMGWEIHKELLFARNLTDTKGKSIYNVLQDYLMEKSIPLPNIILEAADGALAMFGHYREFISHLKQNVPGVFTLDC